MLTTIKSLGAIQSGGDLDETASASVPLAPGSPAGISEPTGDTSPLPSTTIAKTTSDEERMDQLFQCHHQALWRFAVRMTGDTELARDLTQDTFLRALPRRLPENDKQAEAWLMQTLVNLCRDSHRRKQVRHVHRDRARLATDPQPTTDPEASVLARGVLEQVIAGLSVNRRAVLVLRELEGQPVEAIAKTLGLRIATVRWHLSRAKKDLQKKLKPTALNTVAQKTR